MWAVQIIVSQFIIGMICCIVCFLIWKLTSGRHLKW